MKTHHLLLISILLFVSCLSQVAYTPCSESTSRLCPSAINVTERLLSLKRGGQFIITTGTYNPSFYLCEEYNYNCGYMEKSTDFLTIS